MPIKIEDVKKFEGYESEEIQIVKYLETFLGEAFTAEELFKILGKEKQIDSGANERTQLLTGLVNITQLAIFRNNLNIMVEEEKLKTGIYENEQYFWIE